MKNNVPKISMVKHFESRLAAVEKIIDVERRVMEHRLGGLNEAKKTLDRLTAEFITRNEYKIEVGPLIEDIRILRESKAMLEGKASQLSVTITLVISILALLIGIVGIICRMIGK